MQDVMLDLETFGTTPGSVIRSIGAVFFDPRSDALGPEFYVNVDRASCDKVGLIVDASTEAWWADPRRAAARAALEVDPKSLSDALWSFSAWWQSHGGERVWSHGANFDQPLVEAAYRAVGMQAPWSFWNSRCTRTLFDVAQVDTRKLLKGEVKHNAADDARIQARAVQACFRRLFGLIAPPTTVAAAPTAASVFG